MNTQLPSASRAAVISSEPRILDVPLDRLRESPLNTRKSFDPAKLKELADSIRANGILTPLLVRPFIPPGSIPETPAELKYEILAGARRFRAAKLVGLSSVSCISRDVDGALALEIITIENLQREDLSPIEEAEGFKALLDLGKYDVAGLAKRLGMSQSYVYQRVKLVDLEPEGKKALAEGVITPGHAVQLARLQPQDQARLTGELRQHRDGRGGATNISVRDLGRKIAEEVHLDLRQAPFKLDDAKLVPAAGACDACPKRESSSCLDAQCYERKVNAHLAAAEKNVLAQVLKISTNYHTQAGVLRCEQWQKAKPWSCKYIRSGLVMDSGWIEGGNVKRGEQLLVCADKNCAVHWPKRDSGESSDAARYSHQQKDRERKERALQDARTQALIQIVAKTKTFDSKAALLQFAARTNYEGQKLACHALGVWPKEGKPVRAFDFRDRLLARIEKTPAASIGPILAALTLAPDYGRWSAIYNPAGEDLKRLHDAGKRVGIDVAKLEREAVRSAQARKKPKAAAKPELQTSANVKRAKAGKRRKAGKTK